jgi:hypothetical protein
VAAHLRFFNNRTFVFANEREKFSSFYELDLELLDFQRFHFSPGETKEEVTRKGKSKSDRTRTTFISIA